MRNVKNRLDIEILWGNCTVQNVCIAVHATGENTNRCNKQRNEFM